MKKFSLKLNIVLIVLIFSIFTIDSANSRPNPGFVLYKNTRNQGILIYPSPNPKSKLIDFVKEQRFKEVDRGQTVMRFGTNRENLALMMPEKIQNKHKIRKFILIQQLGSNEFMIGVYDPEWGLSLPSPIFGIEELITNIPKTLNVFDNIKEETKA